MDILNSTAMKTLLQIYQDDGGISIDADLTMNSMAAITMTLYDAAMKNVELCAVISAVFEQVCRQRPKLLDKLMKNLKKEDKESKPALAINVKPSPSKS